MAGMNPCTQFVNPGFSAMPVFSRLDGLEAESWLSPCQPTAASQPASNKAAAKREKERSGTKLTLS
jgi:hypothetical protein